MPELISKATRDAFREYFVGTTLREIHMEFEAADIDCNEAYEPKESGMRRQLVEQYYHSINWDKWLDVSKILAVYESVLLKLEDTNEKQYKILLRYLKRDGIEYKSDRLIPTKLAYAKDDILKDLYNLPRLHKAISRMFDAVENDPELAIGTAKEIIETTCVTILTDMGIKHEGDPDIMALVKNVRKALRLLPDDIPSSAKGSDVIRRLLSNLGTIAQGLAELRNLYGTGHGRHARESSIRPRHARLAAFSAAALALFLFETYVERRESIQ